MAENDANSLGVINDAGTLPRPTLAVRYPDITGALVGSLQLQSLRLLVRSLNPSLLETTVGDPGAQFVFMYSGIFCVNFVPPCLQPYH